MKKSIVRIQCAAILAAGGFLALSCAAQTITCISLHPPGATNSSVQGTAQNQQAGEIDGRAAIWSDTPASAVILGPARSIATGTTGTRQVGYLSGWAGGYWSGTASSWIPLRHINPVYGTNNTRVHAIDGHLAVGWDANFAGNALLWDLEQGTVTDLRPAGYRGACALDIHGDQQVGWINTNFLSFNAALWRGTANSCVNLHPAGTLVSQAITTSGQLQGGLVILNDRSRHAALWFGSAESHRDVHPAGAESSSISGAMGEWQVGQASFDGHTHAGLWQGTAGSFVDLHAALDSAQYSASSARDIWADARTLKIVGTATTVGTSNQHAMMWVITLPDETPPVIQTASASKTTLWPPNNRLVTVQFNVTAVDDSGECHWRIREVTCNEPIATNDFQILDGQAVSLRATRSGAGAGREYAVWIEAVDASGNVSEPQAVVINVPHD